MRLRPATSSDLALLAYWDLQPHVVSARGDDGPFADPKVKAVLLDPLATNTYARRFYERLGFRCIERRTFGQDDCLVLRLERRDWEATDRFG